MPKAASRIYVVTEHADATTIIEHLVNAATQAQAIKHVVKGKFDAAVATTGDVARLVKAGVEPQEAGEE